MQHAVAAQHRCCKTEVHLRFGERQELRLQIRGDLPRQNQGAMQMLNAQQKLNSIGALILLDLVGEKDLSFPRDTNSTPWLVDIIWTAAARLGYAGKFRQTANTMIDDHIPFAQQGVPVVDIIDLDYAYWHTAEDTLDKLSPESMRVVAEVVLNALPDVGARLSSR